MPEITPEQLQSAAMMGMRRIRNYRRARTMFIREYTGEYYSREAGLMGERPINLIYNAVRVLLPNYVMKNPKVNVRSRYPQYAAYAEKLSLAAQDLNDQLKLKYILRELIVDALFGFAVARTGLANSDNMVRIDNQYIDLGQIFTKRVDLDNIIIDPDCKKFEEAAFIGEVIEIPRHVLLEMDGVDKEAVENLPTSSASLDTHDAAREISNRTQYGNKFRRDQDIVRVAQVWIRDANAMVIFPDPAIGTATEYIKVSDYYGPDGGPYTFLQFSPPVPDNPIPISIVGIWHDLHVAANRAFRKMMDQIDRQKDIVGYRPSNLEDAQEVMDSEDGDMVPMEDPSSVNPMSFGGQNPENERAVSSLSSWFSTMSGNTDQLSGAASDADTATEAQIIQGNSNVTIEDGRDLLYDFTAEINRKQMWYLHTDPLVELPLVRRQPGRADEYVLLTPEDRQGDFLDYNFDIEMKSMSKLSYALRSKRVVDFSTRVIPAVLNSAMVSQQMGMKFNAQVLIEKLAEDLDIGEYMAEVFEDPQFYERLAIKSMIGPEANGKTEENPAPAFMQNGQPGQVMGEAATPGQEANQFAQETAAQAQAGTAEPPAQGGY